MSINNFIEMLKDELETHFVGGTAIRSIKPYEGDLTEQELEELISVIKSKKYHGIMKTEPRDGKIHVIWMRSITLKEGGK
jgi:hypothetical protein